MVRPAVRTAGQCTGMPWTCAVARTARNRRAPPSWRRSVPVTSDAGESAGRPPSRAWSSVCARAGISTGCGDTSIQARYPASASAWTAGRNSTAARRLSYQYPASASGPASHFPDMAEIIGTAAGPGAIPSSAARISSRSASTCGPCEA
jgi:hypothetical protein